MKTRFFWFRRDLRLHDNVGLARALADGVPVQAVFIFDTHILNELAHDDARVTFIYDQIQLLCDQLNKYGSSLLILHDSPLNAWIKLSQEYEIESVFANEDYEPYALKRDKEIRELLAKQSVKLHLFKDQVIFAKNDILKDNGEPYTVYTPFKNKWLSKLSQRDLAVPQPDLTNFTTSDLPHCSLEELGFVRSTITVPDFDRERLTNYSSDRNFPSVGTTLVGPHLRFGTIGIRSLINSLGKDHEVYLSELIWREFFMMILYHYPRVVDQSFKTKYDGVNWRNNKSEFEKWCSGMTGFPMVDAGMRELNATGFMHNRVRMVVASFLCKHLLIDWRWGEAYFAEKLLDYELASNNGNWQWAAGTGCDAAPYFRIFNPDTQIKKFDPDLRYIKKWVPDLSEFSYPKPMVDHKLARERALEAYKEV